MERKRILNHSNGLEPYTWIDIGGILYDNSIILQPDDVLTIGWIDGWCGSDSECEGHYSFTIDRVKIKEANSEKHTNSI